MTFDVEFQMNPMTLDVDMGTVYDVTGDEYERGYAAGESEGYNKGKTDGYKSGYEAGETAGYSSGQAAEQAVTDSIVDGSISRAYVNGRVTTVRAYAFQGCSNLTSVAFPRATSVDSSAFYGCKALTFVDFPLATSVGNGAFYGCTGLTSVAFPRATSVGASAFYGCTKITALILHTNQVCTLSSTSAFKNTPIASGTGYIYVPDELVDSYKAATNWSTYAAQIKPLSDWEG